MGYKLQRTDGVGDTLEIVALSVGEVIHRIAVPLGTGAVMWYLNDAVHDRVTEVHVGVGHVEFGSEHHRSLYGLWCIHLLEQPQIFLHGAVTVGAGDTRGGRCTLLLSDLLSGLLVDVGIALLDHPNGEIPQLLEVVRGIVDMSPLEAEPLDVVEDVLDILGVFLRGVGVVEPQVADAIELLSHTEVHADGFGVSDMQIAVGLWREARLNASSVFTIGQILLDKLLHETQAMLLFAVLSLAIFHIYSDSFSWCKDNHFL